MQKVWPLQMATWCVSRASWRKIARASAVDVPATSLPGRAGALKP